MLFSLKSPVIFILATCLVACRSVTAIAPTAAALRMPTGSPAASKPPAATLEINGQTQTSGIGSYCWHTAGSSASSVCADVAGIPSAREPLIAKGSPYTATFHLPFKAPPSSLLLSVKPAAAEAIDGLDGLRLWDSPYAGWSSGLPLKQDVTNEFQDSPGLYVIELDASWKEYGKVSYGFLVQVENDASASRQPYDTPSPTKAPVTLKTIAPLSRIGKGNVLAMTVSEDGRRLALGTSMGVSLYEPLAQKERWLRSFDSQPSSLAFNPDGTQLAIGLAGKVLPIIETNNGETLMVLQGEDGIHGVWSPNGKSILTSGGCEQVLVWDARTGKITHTIQPVRCNNATPGFVNAVWSGDGKRIYVGSVTGYVQAWDASTFQPLSGYQPHPPEYTWSISIFPSPAQPLFALENGLSVAIMDGETGEIIKSLQGERQDVPINQIAWSPDGKQIAAGNGDQLLVWEVSTGKQLASIKDYQVLSDLAWLADNQTLVGLFSADGSLIGLNVVTGKQTFALSGFETLNINSAPGWDGDTLLTYDGVAETRWDPQSGNLIEKRQVGQPTWLSFDYAARSPDGRLVASPNAIKDDSTHMINQLRDASEHDKVAWSPDGSKLVSGNSLYIAQTVVWDAQSGDVLLRPVLEAGDLTPYLGALAWSPDGRWIAGGGSLMNMNENRDDGFVVLWDAPTGRQDKLLKAAMTSERIQSIAWSPDNRWLAAGSSTGKIFLWDLKTVLPVAILNGHVDQVLGLSFSPSGRLLASAAMDGVVMVWQIP